MRTLGVTGGIGSGKTTVCRMLEDLGAVVFYADEEGKRILVEDADARREIIDAFGEESYHADGRLNRAYLARTVFGDEEQVRRINRIVHPRVFARFEAAVARAEAGGVPLMVKEAALIFESGGDRFLDAVAVVEAPIEARVDRVVTRDGAAPEDIRARMSHQLPAGELRQRADYLIDNSGTLAETRRQVETIYREMISTGSS